MPRSKECPISILRSVPNCRWTYRYTKLSPELRKSFFENCAARVEGDGEESKRWRKLFRMLAVTSREQLLAKVNGDKILLYHCFNWGFMRDYQRNAQRERRARRKG